ncbi:MAG: ComF family protein [Gammaproteobacteria bacterium]|nr:ComF family protein [Gammaproteobacteria bacterium]
MFSKLHYLSRLYEWFFPRTCILCHYPSKAAEDLCEPCFLSLPILHESCIQCAKNLPHTSLTDLVCGKCQHSPPPFDRTYALFTYQSPITKLIMELKFHERLVNAKVLGDLLAKTIQHQWYTHQTLPEIILPIPLHNKRLKKRGFNQALEIARPIGKRLHIPIDTQGCLRTKHTEAQAQLALKKRTHNIKNAFYIRGDYTNRHVAILDDVTTTGHTISEFSKALKKAGARRIDVWCCAKTLLN